MSNRLLRAVHVVAIAAGLSATAGCDGVYGMFYEEYDGPRPDTQPLVDEIVVVRIVKTDQSSSDVAVVYGDRVKYVDANDPHDINRVVYLEMRTVQPRLTTAQVSPGDTLRVSTRYDGRIYLEGRLNEVPDWPRPAGSAEYPIGRHTVTQYRR